MFSPLLLCCPVHQERSPDPLFRLSFIERGVECLLSAWHLLSPVRAAFRGAKDLVSFLGALSKGNISPLCSLGAEEKGLMEEILPGSEDGGST